MSLEKFIDFLITKELHFCPISDLGDKYEAQVPEKYMKAATENYLEKGLTTREAEQGVTAEFFQYKFQKDGSFVNCWSLDTDESYALWKIYLDGAKTGVAIQTRVRMLKKSIIEKNLEKEKKDVFIGKVKYGAVPKYGEINRISVCFLKKGFYKYENEARILIDYFGEKDFQRPVKVPIDPSILVENIFVSPFASDWFFSVVSNLVETYQPDLLPKLTASSVQDR